MATFNVTNLKRQLDELHHEDFQGDQNARLDVIAAAVRLVNRLRKPAERCFHDLSVFQPMVFAALQTSRDIGLWDAWSATGGGEKTLNQLVDIAQVDIDPKLLRVIESRLCRLLVAADVLQEKGEDFYAPTSFSLSLSDETSPVGQHLQCFTDHWNISARNMPTFLNKIGYREPSDSHNTSYKDGNAENLDFWARCSFKPIYQKSFTGSMECFNQCTKVPWTEFYDTGSLLKDANLERPLIVDIGGNTGADMIYFASKHPDIPSESLIIQDRPDALELAIPNDKIRLMAHDFFALQPVEDSRAYFLHSILHDWADLVAIRILQSVAPAMKRGYSKLLICETVLPMVGATPIQATLDVSMMATLSGRERTEEDWGRLISESGFRIVRWWKDPHGNETCIEAELS